MNGPVYNPAWDLTRRSMRTMFLEVMNADTVFLRISVFPWQ